MNTPRFPRLIFLLSLLMALTGIMMNSVSFSNNFAAEMWGTYREAYGDDRNDLQLYGTLANQAIYLHWEVRVTLPTTAAWQIDYGGPMGNASSPITNLPSETRAYMVTGLSNYTPYTITLHALLGSSPILADTATV